MDDISSSWLIIIICLIASAFFSGMEIAFVSANNLKIELDKKNGVFTARINSWFKQKPSFFIGTMLVGNNIALVIYGIEIAKVLEPQIELIYANDFFVLITQTIISTIIILFTAEFLPKAIFRINPNLILSFFTFFNLMMFALLSIPMFITIGIAQILLKIFVSNNTETENTNFGRIDLDNFVKEMSERAKNEGKMEQEIQMFNNALEFSDVKIRECMIPRNEIEAINVSNSVDVLREKFTSTGYSKILVYRDSIDNIIGYVHSFDLLKKPEAITSILRPVSIVPETLKANEMLQTFTKQQRNIAIVVDEFGGTAGMVTTEDLMEEIFGEIEDEHDSEDFVEQELGKNSFRFSARLEIDYINETYDLQLPESEEYETLAGLIIYNYESIPEQNEIIVVGKYQILVEQVSNNKIEVVKIIIKED